ncbi:hypothetical protein Tco_1055900 [Tanacetum coccineum]|uniref:Uncharacterized protein n=1 Tax=Tanacetum coccineum TaxID=301880 RepID=A0ABQ5H0Z2_9ASTR
MVVWMKMVMGVDRGKMMTRVDGAVEGWGSAKMACDVCCVWTQVGDGGRGGTAVAGNGQRQRRKLPKRRKERKVA